MLRSLIRIELEEDRADKDGNEKIPRGEIFEPLPPHYCNRLHCIPVFAIISVFLLLSWSGVNRAAAIDYCHYSDRRSVETLLY